MNRIKDLREEKNVSMMQAAKDVNLPYTTYVNYEKNLREPNFETLIALANYFEVSVDFLIGRNNIRTYFVDTHDSTNLKLNSKERAIICAYRELNEEGAEKVEEYIKDISSSGRYIKSDSNGMVSEA